MTLFAKIACDIPRTSQEVILAPQPPPKWLTLGRGRPLAQIPSRAWYEWHWHRGIDPDSRRPKIPARTRRRVIERDGYVCGICGRSVEHDDVHIDHIEPWSLTGNDDLDNLQVAHSQCNLRKGNRA